MNAPLQQPAKRAGLTFAAFRDNQELFPQSSLLKKGNVRTFFPPPLFKLTFDYTQKRKIIFSTQKAKEFRHYIVYNNLAFGLIFCYIQISEKVKNPKTSQNEYIYYLYRI